MNAHTQETVHKLVAALDAESRTVLKSKYGFRGAPQRANKTVGKLRRKSAAYIDAAEKKAVRLLRRTKNAPVLNEALDAEDELIWKTVSTPVSSCGEAVFKKEAYESLLERLPGEIMVLIRAVYNDLPQWLADNAVEAPNAWFRCTHDKEEVFSKLNSFSAFFQNVHFPVELERILEKLAVDRDFLQFLTALHDRTFGVYRGYLAEKPISSVALRSIRLHLMMVHGFRAEAAPLDHITEEYNLAYKDDRLTPETAAEVLVERPHLFTCSGSERWAPNGDVAKPAKDAAPGDAGAGREVQKEEQHWRFERPWSETTASDIILEIVQEKGICHQKEIMTLLMERAAGRFKEVNVQIAVAIRKEFIQLAPSVYGWARRFQEIDPVSAQSDRLLTSRDCLKYVRGRYAGEPMNSWPLWTPAMERKWCLWARDARLPKLYQSLLYIANPDLWPASDAEKEEWKNAKTYEAHYYYDMPVKLRDWEKLPYLQDLFLVASEAKTRGWTNWLRINRLLNQIRRYQSAVPILMGLIVLDVVLPADKWQKLHVVGPSIDGFLSALEAEIKDKGFLHWDDDAGNCLRGVIRKQKADEDLGWVAKEDRAVLAELLKPGLIRKNIAECRAGRKKEQMRSEKNAGKDSKMKGPEQLSLF